jgi:type 1 glutamine amidotransferase
MILPHSESSCRCLAEGTAGRLAEIHYDVRVLIVRARLALVSLAIAACAPGPAEEPVERVCDDPDLDAGYQSAPVLDAGVPAGFKILLYTYSTGFRHESIPAGISAIRALGMANGFGVDVKGSALSRRGAYCINRPEPADVAYFTAANLSQYAAVVFLNTTTEKTPAGTFLDDAGKAAFEGYIRGGGGFVGVHAAADAEYGWAFYHDVLGATFLAHGQPVTSTLRIEDATHPATSAVPNPWSRYDEWYDFAQNPRPTARVLINLDETTYPNNPNPMGDHPIAWCKTVGAGRSFYTGIGHTGTAFEDAIVLRHLLGGILYAAGAVAADCSPR